MAHADVFPNDVLDVIAAQVAAQLSLLVSPAVQRAARVEVGETFAIWMLGADAVTRSDTDIAQLAQLTGHWHHQIRYDAKPEAFARSVPFGPTAADWSVQSLHESEIAKKIDAAIDWVDKNVKGDPLVRLLICPAYYMHAFWLVSPDGGQILVIDMPNQYTLLKYDTLYSPKEFLDNLAKEHYSESLR